MPRTLDELRRRGLEALREQLGRAGMIRFLQQFETGHPSTGAGAIVQYLALGCRAHRDRFPFASARLTVTTAYARTVEDAYAHRWASEPEPIVLRVSWVTDGDTTRCDETYPPDLMEKEKASMKATGIGHYLDTRSVRRSRFELWDIVTTAQLFAAPLGQHTYEGWSPFNLKTGPPVDERVRLHNATYVGDRDLDGSRLPVLRISLAAQGVEQVDYYWIGPSSRLSSCPRGNVFSAGAQTRYRDYRRGLSRVLW